MSGRDSKGKRERDYKGNRGPERRKRERKG